MLRFLIALSLFIPFISSAQIGYQVALINNATGEPRALETVSVDLTITDNEGHTIFSGAQNATTNDFGILSLSVGNENTFKNVDWGKLPLYISATVDGVLIGKTQILNVPVAEYAKTTGVLTIEKLCKSPFRWIYTNSQGSHYYYSLTFSNDSTGIETNKYTDPDGRISTSAYSFRYFIDNNLITIVYRDQNEGSRSMVMKYIPEIDAISYDEKLYSR